MAASGKTQAQLEDEAREWIEAITGEDFMDPSNFAASLGDGVLLCKCVAQPQGEAARAPLFPRAPQFTAQPLLPPPPSLPPPRPPPSRLLNVVQHGSVPRFSEKPKNAAARMDNVGLFLRAIRNWGMKEFEMFSSNDLSEGKNIKSVVNCVHALGRLLQSGEFAQLDLPKLGAKVLEKNVRVFTAEQLAESRSAVSALTLGSSDKARSASKSFMAGKTFKLGPGGSPSGGGGSGGAPQANYGGKVVLPPGWEFFPAKDGKRTYYGHKALGISVWEKPTAEAAARLEAEAAARLEAGPLPPGWEQKTSRSTGKTYFFHAASNVTEWERPKAVVPEVVEPPQPEGAEAGAAAAEAAAAEAAAAAAAAAEAAPPEAPPEAVPAAVAEGEEEKKEEEAEGAEGAGGSNSSSSKKGSKRGKDSGKKGKKGEEEEEEEEEGGGSKGGSTMVSNPLRVSKGGKGGGKGAVPQMPKGWEEFQTKEGAYYYFNRAKGITTWEKVRGPRPAARAARPHAPALTTLVPPTSRFLPHKQPKPVYL